MKITNLKQFEEFLKTRIPTREALFMGDIGIKRAQYFMRLIGNPQNKIKVIHIAGTSGKGSTAYLTSHIFKSQGFKVGLSISPHVFDIRERMQINNALLDEKLILKYFNQILPIILKMEKSKYGSPTFFEINVGLAFYMFAKEKLDYAIMETGLGGRLDATNTVSSKNKICLITKIGLDHTEILGKTIQEIASEKAGIIQKRNIVISQQSSHSALKIIKERAASQEAELKILTKKNYSIISSTPTDTQFRFSSLNNIKLSLIGKHQAENCSLALSCLFELSKRNNFKINETSLRQALSEIKIPGRMEMCKTNKQTFILDGAHNPQKMETFTKNLSFIYPNQKFVFALAFKKGKDWKKMLKKIIPVAEKIFISEFSLSNQDNHLSSVSIEEVSKFLLKNNFSNHSAIKKEDIFKIKNRKPIIITGSLYFIGSLAK